MRLGWLQALGRGLAEVFLLRNAERVVRSYDVARLETVRAHKRAAAGHLRASRRLARPIPALLLLDAALESALAAVHAARGAADAFDSAGELAWLEGNPARPPGSAFELVHRRNDADPRDFALAESIRDAFDEMVAWILANVESRTPIELHALRWGRAAAIVLAVGFFGSHYVRDHWLVHDVALHKPVATSALRVNPPAPEEVVDGRTRGTYGVHTADGRPFVTIDLERTYSVRRVRIYNRGDGWFDDVLPLTLSVSTDGSTFDPVATRTRHFDVWNVELGGRAARWVRVSKDSGYIALNEIEVYARE